MMRRGGITGPLPPSMRPALPPELVVAMEMFNLMGGLDWAAVPVLFAMYDIDEPARMITRLAMIRDKVSEPSGQ